MKPLTILLILAFCVGWPSRASAQTARQGDPDAKPIPTAFHSPMILEVPFIAADRSTWGKGWQSPQTYIDLGKFTVDNVALRGRLTKSGWESGLQVKAILRRSITAISMRWPTTQPFIHSFGLRTDASSCRL